MPGRGRSTEKIVTKRQQFASRTLPDRRMAAPQTLHDRPIRHRRVDRPQHRPWWRARLEVRRQQPNQAQIVRPRR